jgi:PKD repeat protein
LLDTSTVLISGSGNSIRVYFTQTGNHTIAVRETNQLFCAGDSISVTINVLENAQANFIDSINELTVLFTNTSTATLSCQWFFGDGTSTNTYSPTHVYPDSGTYNVILVASNGVCNDTFIKTIQVNKCPIANFTYSNSSGNTVYFFSSSSYADSLFWDLGDGDNAYINNPIHIYATDTNYIVTLYVFNKTNCSDSISIEINTQGNIIPQEILTKIHLYPNPVNKYLHVESIESIDEIQIYNNLNQLLFEQKEKQSTHNLNLEFLDAGIYYIKIYSPKEVFIYNFIKQ